MDIHKLRTFLAVLEQGSFSRAAEALHLTQSTVSFHIKSLEVEAGAQLLDRRRGRVRLTPGGRTLEEYARKIVSLRNEALTRMKSEERGEVGTVTLAASTIPGEYLLPPILASFGRLHPRVQVDLRISDSRQALQDLLSEKCDMALVGSRPPAERVIAEAVAEDDIILVGSSPSPHAPALRISHDALRRIPLILRESGSGTHAATLEFFRKARLGPEQLSTALRVGSTQAAKQSVLAGAGLAFISRLAVGSELRAGDLVRLVCPDTPIRRHIYLGRLRGVTLSRSARTLVSYIRHNIR